jgi:3-phytase
MSNLFLYRYVLVATLTLAAPPPAPVVPVAPVVRTSPDVENPDDPAIWIHPRQPARSLILGTRKAAAPAGALMAYGLDGKRVQLVEGLDRPNNVDVEYGLTVGGRSRDIAVVTERNRGQLRIYFIDSETGALSEAGVVPVFRGEAGERALPMGIALYKRPRDGAVFAIVSRKNGPREGYLWQYRLRDGGDGRILGEKVRAFGNFSGSKEIEAVAVDDELGFVYYSDEDTAIRKWHADPEHPDAAGEVAVFGKDGFAGNREGIAIYTQPNGRGYVICSDQRPGDSEYRIYSRDPRHELVAVIRGGADSTDGVEVTSANLGKAFPKGMFVVMNNQGGNFLIYPWHAIRKAARLR